MFQGFWTYALTMVVSIVPVVIMLKMLWAGHNMAVTGSIRKMVTYLVGLGVVTIASVMILSWAFYQGLPIVNGLLASNPATVAINDAGLQLTGVLDNAVAGGFTMPSTGSDGNFTMPSLPSLTTASSGGFTMPSLPAAVPTAAPEVAPTVEAVPDFLTALLTNASEAGTINTANVASVPAAHDWAGYTVKPGDSMGSIARRYGVNLADLCGMNASVIGGNCNLIKVGMQIKLPMAGGQAPREVVQIAKPVIQTGNNTRIVVQPTTVPVVKEVVAAGGQTYTIKAGDTIYKIAGLFGGMSKVYAICAANRGVLGDNCDNLQAGAVIVIK